MWDGLEPCLIGLVHLGEVIWGCSSRNEGDGRVQYRSRVPSLIKSVKMVIQTKLIGTDLAIFLFAEESDELCSTDKLVGVGVYERSIRYIRSWILFVRALPKDDLNLSSAFVRSGSQRRKNDPLRL